MESGSAQKAQVEVVVEVGVVPESFVGGGGRVDMMLDDLEGVVLEGDGAGWLPVFESRTEGFVEGGDLTVIGGGGAEVDSAVVGNGGVGVGEESGDGEGFFGLVVVKFSGKDGVYLADLVEEPSM